jgi:hypothetical protein
MKKEEIKAIFNKFAGREIPMVETTRALPRPGPDYPERTYTEVKPRNADDPVLREMKKAAADNGLQLDVYWQGGSGTRTTCFGWPESYVVAHVEKEADGKWRVSKMLGLSPQLK